MTLSTEMYKLAAFIMNGVSALIILIIITTMPALPGYRDKRIGRFYMALLSISLLAIILDTLADIFWKQREFFTIYRIFSYSDVMIQILLGVGIFIYILFYIGKDVKFNRICTWIITVAATVNIIALATFPLNGWVFYFDEEALDIAYGPGIMLEYICVMTEAAALFAALIYNIKKTGIIYTFLLIFLIITPYAAFEFLWDELPLLYLFLALVELVSYITIFQGKIWESTKQEKELAEKKAELTDMRTKLVLSQVQPHFMYNTLSTIAYFCKADPGAAQKLTVNFSSYLRRNIDSLDGDSVITFEKELDHVKTYLEIEKYRFEERLQVEYDIEYTDFELPALVLQPVVENAVKHGICKKPEGGTVTVSTRKDETGVIITVKDDGVGFDPAAQTDDGKNHIGLKSVRDRLSELCHGKMEIESKPGEGTTVKLFIPEVTEDDNIRD